MRTASPSGQRQLISDRGGVSRARGGGVLGEVLTISALLPKASSRRGNFNRRANWRCCGGALNTRRCVPGRYHVRITRSIHATACRADFRLPLRTENRRCGRRPGAYFQYSHKEKEPA
jgi:hypothetical protein